MLNILQQFYIISKSNDYIASFAQGEEFWFPRLVNADLD
jgi:hypothetical protein